MGRARRDDVVDQRGGVQLLDAPPGIEAAHGVTEDAGGLAVRVVDPLEFGLDVSVVRSRRPDRRPRQIPDLDPVDALGRPAGVGEVAAQDVPPRRSVRVELTVDQHHRRGILPGRVPDDRTVGCRPSREPESPGDGPELSQHRTG
jgi:hypothetical protein